MSSRPLHALLRGVVDYAGLFPPAQLPMAAAAANYAAYLDGAHAWALGRFVLPVARLAELAAVLPEGTPRAPWRLAALPGADLPADRGAIDAFGAAQATRAVVDCVEVRAGDAAAVGAIAAVFHPAFTTYVEVPLGEAMEPVLDAVAQAGLRAKIRTGGVTADAFPEAGAVARFLVACARRDLAFKATAGLHHPLRGEYRLTYHPDAPHGTMFGFLNVLLAACFAREGMAAEALVPLLEERDPAAFAFGPDGAAWRGQALPLDAVLAGRGGFAAGFGSCSFAEPIDDLTALALL